MKHNVEREKLATENFYSGYGAVQVHPLFSGMMYHTHVVREKKNMCPHHGYAIVTDLGAIHVHPTIILEPEQWAYVLAHSLLHLAFGHFSGHEKPEVWNAACDIYVARFLADLKFGRPPDDFVSGQEFSFRSEERLYHEFCDKGIPENARFVRMSGEDPIDFVIDPRSASVPPERRTDWAACFALGLAGAVSHAIHVVSGSNAQYVNQQKVNSAAQRARLWFINSFPLLGALAAHFKIIEDASLCQRMGISIAAVDAEMREIYVNPHAQLDDEESRFVIAHELLHVGLSHHTRRQGRDAYLWNVACDYVINNWLVEMGVGRLPRIGALYDVELKEMSAEAIYDLMVNDIRRFRKLSTLRGVGVGDILDNQTPDWWRLGDGLALDDFYRRCLVQGLVYHCDAERGFLPAGLIEEINALGMPPIPWDVQLAQWFDEHFMPIEPVRSYARPSRRQSSTPDIPRPRWVMPEQRDYSRTYGVILDTSGSMPRELLAKALGTIASYSIAHDVKAVRVVFCDAMPYDQGYMLPEAIAESVKIKGRGGTILQPAIDLLERAEDFPADGPLLIITDGQCDRLRIWREHAILMPEGRRLPFVSKGPVFRIS
jgi:predicted metal-dependent peptidase